MKLIDMLRQDPQYLLSRVVLLTIGSLITAASVVVFLLPSYIAPASITGLAVILNRLISIPIGLVMILANIPIQIVALRVLDG